MAVTIIDHRTVLQEADATTNWVGSPSLFTTDPDPIEATGCIGYVVSTTTVDAYATITSVNLSNKILSAWAFPRGAMDTTANGGIGFHIGDGTNRISFHLAGSDVAAFRHDSGPVGWYGLLIDTSNLPASHTVRAGTLAGLNLSAITNIGVTFKTLAKSVGGSQNCFVDIIRSLDPTANDGAGLSIVGGTSGAPGKFLEIAQGDRATGNLQGLGVIRELGAGLYGCQSPIRFGNAAGTDSSWFEETNVALAFESRGLTTTRYKIVITDNGTGTSTVKFGTKVGSGTDAVGGSGCSFTSPSGVGAEWDSATDTDVTDVFVYGSTFSGFTNGIKFRAPQEWAGNTFSGCGTIEPNGAYMVNCSIAASTAVRAMLWNVNLNTDSRIDGAAFVSAGTGHAIEFGASTPSEITLRRVNFNNYASTDGSTGNEAVYNNSGKAITIYVIDGGTPTVRNGAGATTTIVAGAVTVTARATTDTGAAISGAIAHLEAVAGGPFPSLASVTIVNSGTTATVTHTAHGLSTNDKVAIRGASHIANLGVFSITVTGIDTYTYTMLSAPGSNPTGSITSSFVILNGLTDVNGVISMSRVFSADQPANGRIRKSSEAPFYKQATLAGTVSSATGAAFTGVMISDD